MIEAMPAPNVPQAGILAYGQNFDRPPERSLGAVEIEAEPVADDRPAGLSRRTILGIASMLVASCGVGDRRSQTPGKVAAADSGYAAVDGLRIYYEVHGGPLSAAQPPFVLLHGGLTAIDTAFAG